MIRVKQAREPARGPCRARKTAMLTPITSRRSGVRGRGTRRAPSPVAASASSGPTSAEEPKARASPTEVSTARARLRSNNRATMRSSARSRRASSTVSRFTASLSVVVTRARAAPSRASARSAASRASPITTVAPAWRVARSQSSRPPSAMTTTSAPCRLSNPTTRNPTLPRPQTTTCPGEPPAPACGSALIRASLLEARPRPD
jgi:hypothetical protein